MPVLHSPTPSPGRAHRAQAIPPLVSLTFCKHGGAKGKEWRKRENFTGSALRRPKVNNMTKINVVSPNLVSMKKKKNLGLPSGYSG